MAQKYYVVWKGRETGVFHDWSTCKKHIDHFPGARYKLFKTKAEADAAFKGSAGGSTGPTSSQAGVKKKPGVKTYTAVEIKGLEIATKIYTDGGCEPNPGQAGSGIAVYRDEQISELWYGLYNPNGTNNTAELNALFQAMIMAKDELKKDRSVAIFCDSKYSIQCVTQWAAAWEKKGWKKAGGEIKNLALIQDMFALYQELKGKIQILHVNGHVGVEGNELADRMSILAIEKQDPDFVRFSEAINIEKLLAKRSG